jgi:two-component system, chemotaxis family, sensor kinase CheA
MSADIIERMRVAFRAEALDLLAELDTALLTLEVKPGESELVHRVFRAIHTIKGSGATAGFAQLAKFSHRVEEAFDLAREGRLAVTPDLIDCGLKACDVIRAILDQESEDGEAAGQRTVTEALTRLLPHAGTPKESSREAAPVQPASESRTAYEIVFRPNRELFCSGTDPVTLLDELKGLGPAHITARTAHVPVFSSLDPECCYLWWEILLVTDRGEAAIRDVFVFVEDDCEIGIRMLEDQASAVALLGTLPAESLELFVLECEDHLASVENHALALERNSRSRESLDALFRSVHSIKGNAGLLLGEVNGSTLAANHPLPLLMRVAHALESILEPFQSFSQTLDRETVQTVLDTRDAMRGVLESLARQNPPPPLEASLLQRLQLKSDTVTTAAPADARTAAFLSTASQCVEIIGSCLQGIESGGGTGQSLLQTYLRGLKTLAAAASYQKRPDLEEPVALQLRVLEAAMRAGGAIGRQDKAALSGAFQSVCSAVERAMGESAKLRRGVPGAEGEVTTDTAAAARTTSASPSTIRIDQEKLDRLMRVVGELLVARGAFPVLVQKLTASAGAGGVAKELKEAGAAISHIAEELQASVMSIRMLPVKTVFQRFPRLVRDLAHSLGKEVQFAVEGEGIELDKTIVEQIGDPLVHLVRNAVDHGLEAPGERKIQGKNPAGRVTLRAINQAGGVVIEVADDGRGLDAETLKRKAVEKGLLTRDAAASMSEVAAFQLVFLPGLTTAQKVTDVSGRGVGMDVVRNNIRNLQGTIDIQSKRGSGTTFSLKLPVSLMISKGILLEAGSEQYVLPLGSIQDMVKIPAEEMHQYRGSGVAQIRGEVYSIFSLAELFGLGRKESTELCVAIVEAGRIRYGLMVDRFVSEVEVIVKPLAGGLEECKEFQGAAIMGDGRVVLVLNPLECHRLERAG